LSLIFAGTDDSITDFHVEHVLVNVFSVLVLNVGLEIILSTKSVDKLKKEFRVRKTCFKVSEILVVLVFSVVKINVFLHFSYVIQ